MDGYRLAAEHKIILGDSEDDPESRVRKIRDAKGWWHELSAGSLLIWSPWVWIGHVLSSKDLPHLVGGTHFKPKQMECGIILFEGIRSALKETIWLFSYLKQKWSLITFLAVFPLNMHARAHTTTHSYPYTHMHTYFLVHPFPGSVGFGESFLFVGMLSQMPNFRRGNQALSFMKLSNIPRSGDSKSCHCFASSPGFHFPLLS